MRKIFLTLLLFSLGIGASAQTTPTYHFNIPSQNATNYGTLNNANWNLLDTTLASFSTSNLVAPVNLGGTANQGLGQWPLQSTPRFYAESTSVETIGSGAGPFTIPFFFNSFINVPSGSSAAELFALTGSLTVPAVSAANYTSELSGLHGEFDHIGTGTVSSGFGVSGEAFNLGNGTVAINAGLYGGSGNINVANNGGTTNANAIEAVIYARGSGGITNAYGLHVFNINGTAANVINYAAIQIDDPTIGGLTNPRPYAIYEANGLNRFGASICRITADVALTVNTPNSFCSWTLPQTAQGWAFSCDILWAITAGTGTNNFAVGVNSSLTPSGTTNALASVTTATAGTQTNGSAAISASGATNILTGATYTPAATVLPARITGTFLAASTGAGATFAVTASANGTTATAAVKAGSFCRLD